MTTNHQGGPRTGADEACGVKPLTFAYIAGACVLAGLCWTLPAAAETLSISGTGRVPIGENVAHTRQAALHAAKRAALVAAVNKLNGPKAAQDPQVQEAIDTMLEQVGDDLIAEQNASTDANRQFVLRVTLAFDALKLRQMLQDAGIASTTARQFPILVVMDEFFTTATDKTKPLRELVEFRSDRASSFSQADRASFDSANASSSSSAMAGREHRAAAVAADNGQVAVAARSQQSAQYAAQSQRSASERVSASRDNSVAASSQESVAFRKLVEYQPQNVGPDAVNYTYAALLREGNQFDLSLLDNDLFRSRYLKNAQPLTLAALQQGTGLGRYVQAAREFKADYFMAGNAIIIQGPVDPSTGQVTCDGLVSLKAYSTEDGHVLAADARTESASGNSADQCRVNVSNKLARFVGSTLGSSIHGFWRQRQTYGREYTIRLVSLKGQLSEDHRDDFADALETLQGVQNKIQVRRSDRQGYEVMLTYKGDADLAREIRRAVRDKRGFSNMGRKMDGTTMLFCLESDCPNP